MLNSDFFNELKRQEQESLSLNPFSRGGLESGAGMRVGGLLGLSVPKGYPPRAGGSSRPVRACLLIADFTPSLEALSPFLGSVDTILRDNLQLATMTTMPHLFSLLGDSEH